MTSLSDSPLDWEHETTAIPASGLSLTRTATEAERGALAAALDLPAIDALTLTYRIVPGRAEPYRMTGRLSARVVQPCVVTLEPVAGTVEEDIDIVFADTPGDDGEDGAEGEEKAVLDGPDRELIDNGRLPIGRIAYEVLSAGLDPYPRKDGAEFQWSDPKAADIAQAANPFAALKALKRGE